MQKAGAALSGLRLPRYGGTEAQPAHCCTKARAASPAVVQTPAPRSPQTYWKALRTVSVMRPSLMKKSSAGVALVGAVRRDGGKPLDAQ